MKLWQEWYKVVRCFQSGCTCHTAYVSWVLILQGFTLSGETEGVSGLIRRGGLRPLLYKRLLHFFNASQALALLVAGPLGEVAALLLLSRIHEGLRASPRDGTTLLDRLVEMVSGVD